MSFVSSIKPEDEIKKQSTYEFNDKSWESYIEKGLQDAAERDHKVYARHNRLMEFQAKAGERPIKSAITTIHRMKPASNGYKECLVVHERLTGTTWAEEECILDDHIRGYWKQQTLKPVINEKKETVEYVQGQEHDIYDIDYSVTTLEKLLEGQNKESIKFHIDNPHGAQSADFYYEDFILSWNDCINILLMPGGPMAYHVEKIRRKGNAST